MFNVTAAEELSPLPLHVPSLLLESFFIFLSRSVCLNSSSCSKGRFNRHVRIYSARVPDLTTRDGQPLLKYDNKALKIHIYFDIILENTCVF
jgi:hypothetical protein